MDNLTHAFVGAAIGRAGADRLTPLATPALVVAANAPDVDMAAYLGGPYTALALRRGLTHGWPALLLLPFLVTAAFLAWDRWFRRRRSPDAPPARAAPLLALSAVGVATHPTLDWMNTYGMRWRLPFDGTWSYGDALFIIDPWIWLTLGGALYFSWNWSRRGTAAWVALSVVASALVLLAVPPARVGWTAVLATLVALRLLAPIPGVAGRRRACLAALTAVCAYIAVLVVADGVARTHVSVAAAAHGLDAQDLMVAPVRGNPFVSDVEVVTEESYVPGVHRWLGEPRVELFPERAVPRVVAPADLAPSEVAAILASARQDPDLASYLVWSRYPFARIEPESTAWRVLVSDARYDGVAEAGSLGGVVVTVRPAAEAPGSRTPGPGGAP